MFKSVVTKIWLTICSLILGTLLVFSFFLSNQLEGIYFSHQVKLMNEHAGQWKKILSSNMAPDKIQQELQFWGDVSPYSVVVFDEKDVVRFSSDTTHSPIGEKDSWTHSKVGTKKEGTFYTGYNPKLKMEMTATFLPYTDNRGNKNIIMVHAPTHDLLEMIKATRTTGVYILLLFLGLSSLVGWYFSWFLAKPLMGIRKIALGMAKGDFSTLAATNRNDEVGDLAKTINILSIRLRNTLGSLSRANTELTELLHKWKEFVADVSHELRTPLFLIQGYSEAIMDNVVKDEKTREEYLTVINKETHRLQKMVNDLLEVERGLPINRVPTDLYRLAVDSIAPFEIAAREKNVVIEVDSALKTFEQLNLDPDKFGEVLYNLVDNALRYTANGKITISGTHQSLGRERITVADTGSGIPAEHLPHLFDRFYRVDKARSRARGGSGLGLAIVKKIVEEHDGEITVTSEINKGTTFAISIPSAQKHPPGK